MVDALFLDLRSKRVQASLHLAINIRENRFVQVCIIGQQLILLFECTIQSIKPFFPREFLLMLVNKTYHLIHQFFVMHHPL